MELESKLYYSPEHDNKTEQFFYNLSGMGGIGTLVLTKGFNDQDQYCIHIKCEGGIKNIVTLFDFEGLSVWEKANPKELTFVSFEEIEHTKEIYKKWEFYDGHLQFLENKKGLVQEREVSYSVPRVSPENRIYDPLSVVAYFNFEKIEPNQVKTLFLLGKQQILQTEVMAKRLKERIKLNIKPISGANLKWEKVLSKTDIYLTEEGHIEEIIAPTFLPFGELRMQISEKKEVDKKEIKKILKAFTAQV